MLTADLVAVRRRGDSLSVVGIPPSGRARAHELAATYLGLAHAHVGQARAALTEAFRFVSLTAAERRLGRGLAKLVLDRCTFEEGADLDAQLVRRTLFRCATAARRDAPVDRPPISAADDRDAVPDALRAPLRDALIEAAARELGATAAQIERALYADLPDAHTLVAATPVNADALLLEYETAAVQAVLLRAVNVTATVSSAAPGAYRHLFRKLKFLRLLHRIERLPDTGGFRVEIDGPFSLFAQVTRYGLQLALALPAIAACDQWTIEANLLWGRARQPLRFRLAGRRAAGSTTAPEGPPVADDVAALLADLADLADKGSPWRAQVANAILDLPGLGACVPDLAFTHENGGPTVYLESLGFWNRAAVWKRIELVTKGLPHPLVFAASKHLRVSEEAMPADAPSLLYVYNRTMNARAVIERVEEAARRSASGATLAPL